MLEIFNRDRLRAAIAENACGITEDQKINDLWYLTFSLPYKDVKNKYCTPFNYVRYDNGELYRIMPMTETITDEGFIEYRCEHVLASLLDKIMFGHHTIGNIGTYTADCIRYVLSQQETANWVLSECDFNRQFEYNWEQENLLSALYSIAAPLESYVWLTDTSIYPWRLSLKRLATSSTPELYIHRSRNMLAYKNTSDPQQLCTRLYPLGYGEGINQLTIKAVNGGVPYLQSPQTYIDRYGVIERTWTDRRYENAESLKAAAQAMLDELQEPAVELDISYIDIGRAAAVGERVRVIHPDTRDWTDTYITDISYRYDDMTSSTIRIANKRSSIASSFADLSGRQRIEETYAQGATQIYSQALQANCDKNNGAQMDFIIPSEMRIINKVLAKIRMGQFLSYSKSTEASAEYVTTTSTKESVTETGSAGGGGSYTSESGGFNVNSTRAYLVTTGTLSSAHVHDVYVNLHKHSVNGLRHAHDFTVPGHNHDVPIPSHAHGIIPGIFKFGSAKRFSIYVNGYYKGTFEGTNAEVDITNFLLNDKDKKIPRGTWLSVEVRPDDLAYISIDLIFQGFVQSRGDSTV